MRTRSGRIIALTGPRQPRSPCEASSVRSPTLSTQDAPSRPVASAPTRLETPRKSATKSVAGSSYISCGGPLCSTRPPFMTATRSLIVSASSWSCVTNTNVMPSVSCSALQLDLQVLAEAGVERSERLVEQQHARAQDEGARERDALLLAARELARLALLVARELHQRERLGDRLGALALRDLLVLEPEGDVVGHVEVREERVALEHGVDVAAVRRRLRDVLAVEQDAPAGRPLEARDHAQRRRLAAAGGPDHGEELARRHVHVDAVDRDDVGAERLDELLEPDFALHRLVLRSGGRLLVSVLAH